jgi:hypothetical protein
LRQNTPVFAVLFPYKPFLNNFIHYIRKASIMSAIFTEIPQKIYGAFRLTWSIDETGIAEGAGIDTSGPLTIAEDETAASLIVRAASAADTGKSGTATVTNLGGDTFAYCSELDGLP